MLPPTTSHQWRISDSMSTLPRTAFQNDSVAPSGSRSRTCSNGMWCMVRRFSASSWRMSNRAADFDTWRTS